MVITVTMNPAIDKTLEVENFVPGALHRVTDTIQDAGGKGINVSTTVHALGGETIATGFTGGDAGRMIERSLDDMEVTHQFIHIEGETRTNVEVIDSRKNGFVTSFNEPGPDITSADIDRLQSLLMSYAGPSAIFVFCGSVPSSVDKSIYGYLTRKVKKRQSTVFVDATGELLTEAIKAKPFFIKSNAYEISRYFGLSSDVSEDALINLGYELLAMGINTIAVSRSKDGAIFLDHSKCFKAAGIEVQANSTVGAGAAMVGALTYGLDNDLPYEDCARLSIAASAGACTTQGTKPPSRELVDELVKEVDLTYIDRQ